MNITETHLRTLRLSYVSLDLTSITGRWGTVLPPRPVLRPPQPPLNG